MARKFDKVVLPDMLHLLYVDGDTFELEKPYGMYWEDRGSEYRLIVPAGYRTDLSSIPRLARSIIPVVGRQNGPSVLHDYIYEPLDNDRPEGEHQLQGWTKRDADALFLAACKAAGVNWLRRNIMWAAIRFGGYRAWNTQDK